MTKIPPKIFARQYEITHDFLKELDMHLSDIVAGKITTMWEIRDFANILHLHPTHLSNTIKSATGKAPCDFFEEKILAISKSLLEKNDCSINAVATLLTYDPSNFTKFFKRFSGQTPKQYREAFLSRQLTPKTETVTIFTEAVTMPVN